MLLWLDDIRNPVDYGLKDWVWVKTAEQAINLFKTRNVRFASLDHDLTEEQMAGGVLGVIREDGQKSGYDVVLWLEEHPINWPIQGVSVHSTNPVGKLRMIQVIFKYYGEVFRPPFSR